MCALWSDLPLRGNSALNSRERKKQLSKWLSQTVQKAVESESETEMSAGNRIYTLLSTNNVRQVRILLIMNTDILTPTRFRR